MDIQLLGTHLADLVRTLSGILISTCQLLAIFVISVGVVRALLIFLRSSLFHPQNTTAFQQSRLAMGYSFSLGLSFLVGASILKTMLSSQLEDIIRLVMIIAVRTALNLLLERAIRTNQDFGVSTSQDISNGTGAGSPSVSEVTAETAIANP